MNEKLAKVIRPLDIHFYDGLVTLKGHLVGCFGSEDGHFESISCTHGLKRVVVLQGEEDFELFVPLQLSRVHRELDALRDGLVSKLYPIWLGFFVAEQLSLARQAPVRYPEVVELLVVGMADYVRLCISDGHPEYVSLV